MQIAAKGVASIHENLSMEQIVGFSSGVVGVTAEDGAEAHGLIMGDDKPVIPMQNAREGKPRLLRRLTSGASHGTPPWLISVSRCASNACPQ